MPGPIAQGFDVVYEKLLDKSFINDKDCFVWLGATAGEGYGHLRCYGKDWYIHRLIYREFICEEVPEVVMHICDNPPCWNVEHLVGGTHADNVEDKVQKGRHNFGNKVYISKLNEEAIRDIRSSNLSPPELARKYGVHRASIHKVLDKITWKHII